MASVTDPISKEGYLLSTGVGLECPTVIVSITWAIFTTTISHIGGWGWGWGWGQVLPSPAAATRGETLSGWEKEQEGAEEGSAIAAGL